MKTFLCVLLMAAMVLAEPPRYRQVKYRLARGELEGSGLGKEENAKANEAPYPAAGYIPSREFKLPSRLEVAPLSTSYGVPDDSYKAPFRIQTRPEVEYGVPRNFIIMSKREETEGEKEDEESESGEKGEGSEKIETVKEENKSEKPDKSEGEEKKDEEKEESVGKGNGEVEELEGEGENKSKKKGKLEEESKEAEDDGSSDGVVNEHGAYYVLLPDFQLQRVQYNTQNDLSKMAYTAHLQYKDEDRAPLFVYTAVPEYTVPLAQYQLPTSSAYFQLY
ncbi:uncharacterized protein ACR2FA_009603 [Aphomia sociella]